MTPEAHLGGSAVGAPGATTWAPLQGLRDSSALCRFVTRWRSTPFICLALALAGCEDFPSDPQRTVTVEQPPAAQWPSELSVQDETTLAVDVEDENGSRVTGVGVQWASDNPEVIEVRSLVPPGAQGDEALLAQLKVEIVAHHRGEATITARVTQPGVEASELSQTIRVMEHWTSVSAGSNHACGITIDNDAYCWGSGLLGNGSLAGSSAPVPVGRDLKFKAVTAGAGHSCGLLLDATIVCWGDNTVGALGNGSTGDQPVPVRVSVISILKLAVAGQAFVCGITPESAAFCWGSNIGWQLGDAFLSPPEPPLGQPSPPFEDCGIPDFRCSTVPRRVRDRGTLLAPNPVPLVLSSIAPGAIHTCALDSDGAAICWGTGSVALGSAVFVETSDASTEPFLHVPGGLRFKDITSGALHTCAIGKSDERPYCWGFNSHGQLGTRNPGSSCTFGKPPTVGCSEVPKVVSGGIRLQSLDAGEATSCGLGDAVVYCWGANDFGQLGDPSLRGVCDTGTACSAEPVRVDPDGAPLVSVSVGRRHACAVTARGAAYCWGDSSDGKLGDGEPTHSGVSAPARVVEPD